MKRISQGSSVSLNEIAFESLKPLYGSRGNPPYYDPNDLHAHIWKKGKLGIEDNPKVPTYAKGKLGIKDCIYCKICHLVKDPFQSTVSSNRDIVNDIIQVAGHTEGKNSYKIIEPVQVVCPFVIKEKSRNSLNIPKKINQKLFHKQEGVFENYVEVDYSDKIHSS
jgi:hypothetical protein